MASSGKRNEIVLTRYTVFLIEGFVKGGSQDFPLILLHLQETKTERV